MVEIGFSPLRYLVMTDQPSALHTPASLLLRIHDPRDTASWQTFVDTYAPLVYRYCRQRGLQDADAADVGQEVLSQVARAIRTFEYQRDKGRFRDWLGTVTRHKLGQFLKGKANQVGSAGGEEGQGLLSDLAVAAPDAQWTEEFNAQVLRTALERIRPHFEPTTWQAFSQVWLDRRSALETSQALKVPLEGVYLAKSRVLKRLREEILMLADDLPQFVPL
jgi:RNA polymerase sigma-70 factor (ECF subfamily)